MNSLELQELIKGYSSEKLLDIITGKANSYGEEFLDYAKDELIKRNFKFDFNKKLIEEVAGLSDDELKATIEDNYEDYHLEYLEIARNEYLKRGFKNTTVEEDSSEIKQGRYPALKILSGITNVVGWIWIVISVLFLAAVLVKGSDGGENKLLSSFGIGASIVGIFLGILSIGYSELIKLFIDIKKNTRPE